MHDTADLDAQRHIQKWIKVCIAMLLFIVVAPRPSATYEGWHVTYELKFFWEELRNVDTLSTTLLVPILMLVLLLVARRFRHLGMSLGLLLAAAVTPTVAGSISWLKRVGEVPDIAWAAADSLFPLATILFAGLMPAVAHQVRIGRAREARRWMLMGVLGAVACTFVPPLVRAEGSVSLQMDGTAFVALGVVTTYLTLGVITGTTRSPTAAHLFLTFSRILLLFPPVMFVVAMYQFPWDSAPPPWWVHPLSSVPRLVMSVQFMAAALSALCLFQLRHQRRLRDAVDAFA